MRLENSEHTRHPWLIHGITEDFLVEDVWALPTPGAGPDDFPTLLAVVNDGLQRQISAPAKALFWVRLKLGTLLRLDRDRGGLNARVPSLRERLPGELQEAAAARKPADSPFTFLYELPNEYAGEIANTTMHGVVHFGWVPDGAGGWRGQMAVLVKPNGRFGSAYMAFIKPFRHLIIYPSLTRACERGWRARQLNETQRLDKE
ncbi:MAG: DUF2867 domain-containing protein [Catenulispora sp.]|nr:DUF2867 domain-containing protein [Catenulispora sp.]